MKTLIVIDMQKGFINYRNEYLILGIKEILSKDIFDNVIFTQYKNIEKSPFNKYLNWTRFCDEEEQKLIIEHNGSLIEKISYGISDADINRIKSQNIDEVYLCGIDIDACVLNIAYNLFDNNIKPIFIKELCGTSANSAIEKAAWLIIERNFGKNCICSIRDLT